MKRIIKVKSSSSAEMYDVILNNQDGLISLSCTCKAGVHKMLCKHRIDLLNGDTSKLSDANDIQFVEEFLNCIEIDKLDNIFSELMDVEKEIERLSKKRSKLRKDIGIKLNEGF